MPIQISPLTEADIDGAITTIQEAFADDPYALWVFNERTAASLRRNRVSLGIRCRWGIRNALFHVAKDPASATPQKVLGLAMWMLPRESGASLGWGEWFWEQVEDWRLWGSQVGMNLWYGRGGLNVKRYYIWKDSQAKAQQQLWISEKGYYFLNIITVLPSHQGKGIGRALFDEVTRKADEERVCCYLESSRDKPNTQIYEAIGFKKVLDMKCDDDGEACDLYCMIREPKVKVAGND